MTALVAMPMLVPLLGAGLTLMLTGRERIQRTVSIASLACVAVVAAVLLVAVDRTGPTVVWVGGWNDLGIALVADRLSTLMLMVSSVVTLAVLVYSVGQGMTGDTSGAPVSVYHPTFLVLTAGVSNAFLSGDLFNLFVSFEMLLFASYVLLTLGGTGARLRAGTIYVGVNLLSSMLFLTAVGVIYAATGTVNLAQLSGRLSEIPHGVVVTLQLLLLTTFAIKAAVFPLSFWLPDSYPTAPAPVTAVFAGLLTKVGVYAIMRTQSLLFPDSALTEILLLAALLTLIVGILGAIAQSDIKRMLSFTLVSHIGFMVFGIGLATQAGYAGAIFYVVHHIIIQTALFLVVGLVERRTGTTSLMRIGGLARTAPVLGLLFFVPAMNLAGIPPMSGFLGKVGLLEAGIAVGGPLAFLLVAAGVATSLLTLYAVAKTWNLAFWRTPEQARDTAKALVEVQDPQSGHVPPPPIRHGGHAHVHERPASFAHARTSVADPSAVREDPHPLDETEPEGTPHLPRTMLGAAASLVIVSLVLTVAAGPLFNLTNRAATAMLDRDVYVNAVLPEGHG